MATEPESRSQVLLAAYDAMLAHAKSPKGYDDLIARTGDVLYTSGFLVTPHAVFARIIDADLVGGKQEGIFDPSLRPLSNEYSPLVRGVVALTIADALIRKMDPKLLSVNPHENLDHMNTAGSEGKIDPDSQLQTAEMVTRNERRLRSEAPEILTNVLRFAGTLLERDGHAQSDILTRKITLLTAQTYARVLGFGDEPNIIPAPVNPAPPALAAGAARRVPAGSR